MQSIRKLGPFALSVSNLDRSVAFYKALGFEAGEKYPFPVSAAHAMGVTGADAAMAMQKLTRDGAEVLLLEISPAPAKKPADGAAAQYGLAHLELLVSDLDGVAAEIQRMGGTILESTRSRLTDVGPNPLDMIFCRDPDGTLIALVDPHS
ncbi:MAG: VOC family protein [Sphingobium sp.]